MLVDIGTTWLTIETRPRVPSTALSPSSNGMPAATSDPNAINKMSSVSGTEYMPAVFRSSAAESLSALLVLSPNEPT